MHALLAECGAINADELAANAMWCYLSASDRNVFCLFVDMCLWTRDCVASHCRQWNHEQKLQVCNSLTKSVSVKFSEDPQNNLNLTYDNNFFITSIYLVI